MQKSYRKVILSVINDISTDQRVHRIASTLTEYGYEVTIVGRKLPDSLPLVPKNYQTKRLHLFFTKGKLFYIEFTIRLFFYLCFYKADVYTANDLDTLLPNFLVARWKKKKLVFDAHELFTEVPELIHRPFTRRIWLALEQLLVPRLSYFMTVNEGLAEVYHHRYGIKPIAIRNVPILKEPIIQKPEQKILIYQGALNVGRGIELMIETMPLLPDWKLWIVGAGDIENELKSLVQKSGLQHQVKFWGKIPFEQLHQITSQATIGLSLEEDLGENYRLATPNKVFDYLQAELPVIVSDLPLMKQIVEDWKVGEVMTVRTSETLASLVQQVFHRKITYEDPIRKAKKHLCWAQEQQLLESIYSEHKGEKSPKTIFSIKKQ